MELICFFFVRWRECYGVGSFGFAVAKKELRSLNQWCFFVVNGNYGGRSLSYRQAEHGLFLPRDCRRPDRRNRSAILAGNKLDEAIQLFYVGNEGGAMASSSYLPSEENATLSADQRSSGLGKDIAKEFSEQDGGDDVRPPLPVIREALYDDAMFYGASRIGYPSRGQNSVVAFRNFEEEMKRSAVWESEQGGSSTAESTQDNLAALYRPPFALMQQGPFEKAKLAAAAEDKWLLVNLQSTTEFSSHMLNRDTWGNEAVAQTVKTNFIFWQDLLPFMDGGPKNHGTLLSHKRPRASSHIPGKKVQDETNEEDEELQRALATSMESIKKPDQLDSDNKDEVTACKEEETSYMKKLTYPPLLEEPKGDRNLICRVGFRLPDGRRVQRNFLRTDPIQLSWSFCSCQLGEGETRPFRLTHAVPGAAKSVEYDSKLTFEESGLSNSMISVTWSKNDCFAHIFFKLQLN